MPMAVFPACDVIGGNKRKNKPNAKQKPLLNNQKIQRKNCSQRSQKNENCFSWQFHDYLLTARIYTDIAATTIVYRMEYLTRLDVSTALNA